MADLADIVASFLKIPKIHSFKNETREIVDVEPINQPLAVAVHSFDLEQHDQSI
jgi:hypothetical protein